MAIDLLNGRMWLSLTALFCCALSAACGARTDSAASPPKDAQATNPASDPAGFYLYEGGQHWMEIQRDSNGNLKVQPSAKEWSLETNGQRMILVHNIDQPPLGGQSFRQWVTRYELEPSKTFRGDWDLKTLLQSTAYGRGSEGTTHTSALLQPIPGYMHRANPDARRYLESYKLITSYPPQPDQIAELNRRSLEITQELVAQNPNDVYMHVFLLDALARNRDAARLERELAEAGPRLKQTENPYLLQAQMAAENNLKAIQLHQSGRNAWQNYQEASSKGLSALWEMTQSLPDNFAFIPRFHTIPIYGEADFLGLQTFQRVMTIESEFAIFLGHSDEALKTLAACCRMGQELTQNGPLINRLIGIANRSISVKGLEFYALNASDSARDLNRLLEALEKLEAGYHAPSEEELMAYESVVAKRFEGYELNANEALTRCRVADAQFEVLRLATAARGRLLATGSFPATAGDLKAWFPAGLPPDPFTSATLMMNWTRDKFTAYSAGPDSDDDRAQIAYDPTNGTISNGDVFLEVPRARKYPIPPGGLRAGTPQDVLRQMPNGLPPDPFATTRPRPLNIGNTRPVTIFSWGPDMDEMPYGRPDPRKAPEVHYDPTNGTNSDGDLFMTLPR